MNDDSMVALFRFLMDYPVERTPSGFPDNPLLTFDHYPGQDFVVGLCNEAISETLSGLADPDVPVPNRALMAQYLDLLKRVRSRRIRLLAENKKPTGKPIVVTGNKIRDLQTWLENNEGHPNWDAKLKQYEELVDTERFASDVLSALN